MTVFSIQRILTPSNISIVHLVTDSTLEQVVATDWLLSQQASIDLVNNGAFSWDAKDVLLIHYAPDSPLPRATGSGWFQIFSDFRSVNPLHPIFPNLQNITAHAGGGQTNATQLNIGINVVNVVATAADSVKLPDDVLGQEVIVRNATANALAIFPFLGDSINDHATNASVSLIANNTLTFYGTSTLNWSTVPYV